MKANLLTLLGLVLVASLMSVQFVVAADFSQDISAEDQQTFDEILEPVMKIYDFIKYTATILAVLVLLFSGITYITSGSDPSKREKAKNMATYVIIGLIVIWAAPLIVNFIVS